MGDPTSMDYTQARGKVEEVFINRKIKTSLHELVDDMNLSHLMDEEELVGYKELLESFAVIDRRVYESD
ncbi:hypothetical protein D9619_000165 [Psilocybe cf. subviscida]|uniref:Uncharacterized protein n=1 Tax=Psilocybe cf. subviscida TaxID=2480587 RepID=A0A8H5BGS3_9AGAR|nr:hypothetical protein D9619_000165 [Psilocybe cf. subviscida]